MFRKLPSLGPHGAVLEPDRDFADRDLLEHLILDGHF
jgi:hypothetical protein